MSLAPEDLTPAIITALVKAGTNIEARNKDGHNILHFATQNPNPAIITALVKARAKIEARVDAGLTPLHAAAFGTENPAVIIALLNAGADLKSRDDAGQTPWDFVKKNKTLKGTDAYWRLNDLRF